MNRKAGKRRGGGTVTVLVAITLTGILGAVAIALDGGLMLDNRRRVQAAADAAALAAASDLFTNYTSNGGYDIGSGGLITNESGVVTATSPSGTTGTAALSAKATALANVSNATVTVNIPPTNSVSYNGKVGYAEVIVTSTQTRGFSAIFGSGALSVSAHAVACGGVGDVGIMCLDDVVTETAQICGKVNILNGGQIYINSKGTVTNTEFGNSAGTSIVLSGATLTTGGINLYSTSLFDNVGGTSTITYTNGGSLKTFLPQLTDPLASIAEPTPAGTTYGTTSGYTVSTSTTLQPGQYPGGIQVTGTSISVSMAGGIYYMGTGTGSGSGSFSVSSGATLTGTGVMFYNQLGDNFSPFAGVVSISPPTTGTYRGISFWQPRADPMEIHISGSANVSMTGTWYNVGASTGSNSYTTGENLGNASTGEFDINPATGATFNIGSYICDSAEWFQGTGSSGGTLNLNPGTAAPTQRPTLVE